MFSTVSSMTKDLGMCRIEKQQDGKGGRIVKRVISREKMSRKARRELDRQKRNTWLVSPITRVKESGKVYSRKWKRDVFDQE